MDTRWEGRDLTAGNQFLWEETPPIDLSLRLNDVLMYEECNSQDLWEAFRDWMECRGITRPHARPISFSSPNALKTRKALAPIIQCETAMQLTRLVYSSRHQTVESSELDSILRASERNNARDLITGVLVAGETTFLQLIEGSREAIAKCFERIMADQRHHDVQVISCGDVSRRLFQDCSMRLVNVSKIKPEIISVHSVDGEFRPRIMSEFAIEEFCRALTVGDFEANAA